MKSIKLRMQLVYKALYFYLTLPVFLFFIFWYQPYFSLPLCALLILPFFVAFKTQDILAFDRMDLKNLLISLGLIVFIVLASGVAADFGFGFQFGDYAKHNAVLKDLITHEWPVTYAQDSNYPGLFVYYIGYYLPAAVVGKGTNFFYAMAFQTLWNVIGMVFMALLLFHLFQKKSWKIVFLFFFLSGLDIVGYLLLRSSMPGNTNLERFLPDIPLLSYNWPLGAIFWVPQHAFPALLVPLVMMDNQKRGSSDFLWFLPASLCFSPFVLIGLLPFAAYGFFAALRREKPLIPLRNALISGVLCIFVGMFFLLNQNQGELTLVFKASRIFELWPQLVLFALLEFGFFFLVMGKRTLRQPIAILTLAVLIFFMFPSYGIWNDLGMRATLPAITFVLLLVIDFFLHQDTTALAKRTMLVLLCIGLFTGGNWISVSLQNSGRVDKRYDGLDNSGQYKHQYISASYYEDHPFYRWVLKK